MPGAPSGLTFRPATEADLPACERVWRAGLNGYLGRLGVADVPLDNPGLRRLHAHTLATDPDRFWVATRDDSVAAGSDAREVVVAFGSAVQRGPVWFLSMLFVEPAEQGRGLGRAILQRIAPAPGSVLATVADSAQPVSNALYASLGIVPRMPMLNLVGRPGLEEPPRLPSGITADRLDGQPPQAEIDALDRAVLGFEHPADHAFAAREGRLGFACRNATGDLVGYGYAAESGRVGPIAVRDEALLGPLLALVLTAVVPRGASSVWLPGFAGEAIRTALQAGLRFEEFPLLVCWNRPFADFSRYVPISPGLL